MKKTGWALLLGVFLFLSHSLAATATLDSLIEQDLPALVAAYQLLHAVPEPTIRTGVKAMATAVLDLLKKPAAAEKKTE